MMKIKKCTIFRTFGLTILSLGCVDLHAAALDRAGQSISAFLQNGNYFEASISALDANISGKTRVQYMVPNTRGCPHLINSSKNDYLDS